MPTNNYLQGSCNSILNTIRDSYLNYAVQETPFSIYITIRKSEARFKAPRNNCDQVKTEDVSSKSQEVLNRLKNDYVTAITELEEKNEYITKLEGLLKNSDEKLSKLEPLEEQFNKILEENKLLKQGIDTKNIEIEKVTDKLRDCEERNYEACAANKKLQNQMKILSTENTKIKSYRDKVKEEFQLSKIETKEVVTYLEHKIGDLEDQMKVLVGKKCEENSCQTDAHPEIPYKITDCLPPIFSSQFCHRSRPIHLSNSLPCLDSVCWSKPDENFIDEAEEALNEQYDKQISQFYLDERERVRAARHEPSS